MRRLFGVAGMGFWMGSVPFCSVLATSGKSKLGGEPLTGLSRTASLGQELLEPASKVGRKGA